MVEFWRHVIFMQSDYVKGGLPIMIAGFLLYCASDGRFSYHFDLLFESSNTNRGTLRLNYDTLGAYETGGLF